MKFIRDVRAGELILGIKANTWFFSYTVKFHSFQDDLYKRKIIRACNVLFKSPKWLTINHRVESKLFKISDLFSIIFLLTIFLFFLSHWLIKQELHLSFLSLHHIKLIPISVPLSLLFAVFFTMDEITLAFLRSCNCRYSDELIQGLPSALIYSEIAWLIIMFIIILKDFIQRSLSVM